MNNDPTWKSFSVQKNFTAFVCPTIGEEVLITQTSSNGFEFTAPSWHWLISAARWAFNSKETLTILNLEKNSFIHCTVNIIINQRDSVRVLLLQDM